MTRYVFGAVIRKSDGGGYWAEVPDLPGCFGEGATFIEAVSSISDGLETHLASLVEYGMELPAATKIEAEDGDVAYVYADVTASSLGAPSVSAAEAARRLGVTPSHVSQLIKAGKLSAERCACNTFVEVASIEAYMGGPRVEGRPKKAISG